MSFQQFATPSTGFSSFGSAAASVAPVAQPAATSPPGFGPRATAPGLPGLPGVSQSGFNPNATPGFGAPIPGTATAPSTPWGQAAATPVAPVAQPGGSFTQFATQPATQPAGSFTQFGAQPVTQPAGSFSQFGSQPATQPVAQPAGSFSQFGGAPATQPSPAPAQQSGWGSQPSPAPVQQQGWGAQAQPSPAVQPVQQSGWGAQPSPAPAQQQGWGAQPSPAVQPAQQSGWGAQPSPAPAQQSGWGQTPAPVSPPAQSGWGQTPVPVSTPVAQSGWGQTPSPSTQGFQPNQTVPMLVISQNIPFNTSVVTGTPPAAIYRNPIEDVKIRDTFFRMSAAQFENVLTHIIPSEKDLRHREAFHERVQNLKGGESAWDSKCIDSSLEALRPQGIAQIPVKIDLLIQSIDGTPERGYVINFSASNKNPWVSGVIPQGEDYYKKIDYLTHAVRSGHFARCAISFPEGVSTRDIATMEVPVIVFWRPLDLNYPLALPGAPIRVYDPVNNVVADLTWQQQGLANAQGEVVYGYANLVDYQLLPLNITPDIVDQNLVPELNQQQTFDQQQAFDQQQNFQQQNFQQQFEQPAFDQQQSFQQTFQEPEPTPLISFGNSGSLNTSQGSQGLQQGGQQGTFGSSQGLNTSGGLGSLINFSSPPGLPEPADQNELLGAAASPLRSPIRTGSPTGFDPSASIRPSSPATSPTLNGGGFDAFAPTPVFNPTAQPSVAGAGFGAVSPATSPGVSQGFAGFATPIPSATPTPAPVSPGASQAFAGFGTPNQGNQGGFPVPTAAPGFASFGQAAIPAAAPGFAGFSQPATPAAAPSGFGAPTASPGFAGFGNQATPAAAPAPAPTSFGVTPPIRSAFVTPSQGAQQAQQSFSSLTPAAPTSFAAFAQN